MILVIDNYDSFTYNLVQELLRAEAEVEVIRNDQLSVDEVLARRPEGVLVSPGPGKPADAGICPELVSRRCDLPILGVCLGHQVMGEVFGGTVGPAPELVHGKTSAIEHEGGALYKGVASPFEATRYHSLTVLPDTLPAPLIAESWTVEDLSLIHI